MSNLKRPGMAADKVRRLLKEAGTPSQYAVAILAVRGYFRRTMGDPNSNDRGIYDDALFLVSPSEVRSFNANTDPSVSRKGIATLVPGVHLYRKGNHGITRPGGGYPAFRPATEGEQLPVTRDGSTSPSMGVAINIHRGSLGSTSSEGCQTIHPTQWLEFQERAYRLMDQFGQKVIPYVLIENDGSVA